MGHVSRDVSDPLSVHQEEGMSLAEAASRYRIPVRTLQRRVRIGEIPAYKVSGPWVREWRVTAAALEQFGYRLPAEPAQPHPSAEVAELRREVRALTRALAVERRRADDADRQLGEVMMEAARLRTQLRRAHRDNREDPPGEATDRWSPASSHRPAAP